MKVLPLLLPVRITMTPPAFGQAFGESIQLSQPARSQNRRRGDGRPPARSIRAPACRSRAACRWSTTCIAACRIAIARSRPCFCPARERVPSGTPVILSSPSPNGSDLLHHRWLDADGIVSTIPRSNRGHGDRCASRPSPRNPGKRPAALWPPSTPSVVPLMPLPVNA